MNKYSVEINGIQLNVDEVNEVADIKNLITRVFSGNQYKISINDTPSREFDGKYVGLTKFLVCDSSSNEINIIGQFVTLNTQLKKLSEDFSSIFYLNRNKNRWTEISKYIQLLEIYFSYYTLIQKIKSFDHELLGIFSELNCEINSLNIVLPQLMMSISLKNTVEIADILKWDMSKSFNNILILFGKLGGEYAN